MERVLFSFVSLFVPIAATIAQRVSSRHEKVLTTSLALGFAGSLLFGVSALLPPLVIAVMSLPFMAWPIISMVSYLLAIVALVIAGIARVGCVLMLVLALVFPLFNHYYSKETS